MFPLIQQHECTNKQFVSNLENTEEVSATASENVSLLSQMLDDVFGGKRRNGRDCFG